MLGNSVQDLGTFILFRIRFGHWHFERVGELTLEVPKAINI